jgi:hypothetical protein
MRALRRLARRAVGGPGAGDRISGVWPGTGTHSVWTGRALQAESDDLEKLVLRFCIRPMDGAFRLLAIMDIRARSISFTTRPRRPEGPPDHERAGETFSPSPLFDSQTSAGNPYCFWD